MKSLKIILFLALLALASEALAITHFSDTAISGAGTRSLKSCATMTDGDRSTVTTADGVMFFEFDAASTATENLTTHPYIVQPTTGSGRWVEVLPPFFNEWREAFTTDLLTAVDGILETVSVGSDVSETDVDYPIIEKKDSNGDLVFAVTIREHVATDGSQAGESRLWVPKGGVLTHHTGKGYVSLADTGEFSLVSGRSGFGAVMIGNNTEWVQFRFTSAGAVTIIAESTNVTTTNNTDANLNVYDGGDHVVIENQLGATLTATYDIVYGE